MNDVSNLHPSQQRLIDALHEEFDRISVALKTGPLKDEKDLEAVNRVIAQNLLRTCLEATLNKIVPYGRHTVVDLAIRMASYVVSAGEEEYQDPLIAMVTFNLPEAHKKRLAEGIRLKTTWADEGSEERPNFRDQPTQRDE